MSDCRCEFQGKPVTGHFSYCPVWKDEHIAELKAELAELREALRNLATDPCLRTQQEACRLLQGEGDES